MHLTLVTGGARSGKSDYAERLALAQNVTTTFVATGEASDEEMSARIARHRAQRAQSWITVEAPLGAAKAVASATTALVLLDCLTLLASNALLAAEAGGGAGEAAVEDEVRALLAARTRRDGRLIVVTNEVGLGVVPATGLGRRYRDALGSANRTVAEASDHVVLMVSGIPVVLRGGR
jgi:adenosylcobinamide kinase/adenosylcobinamide-phosphate guanylyltransferase